ncbi:hypothetical protein FA15DRAFT_659751 [Coprinopsis marcescibilis]|uniref:Uncharacterized protein n=1 Tax=Coprinopsis marcescibilis TaxID=230819 RepID=A0A5C3KHZ3_COPMA|nr:hypothetical protein FA15DRAFT_659751 [Coprinopsis marcescibilis]
MAQEATFMYDCASDTILDALGSSDYFDNILEIDLDLILSPSTTPIGALNVERATPKTNLETSPATTFVYIKLREAALDFRPIWPNVMLEERPVFNAPGSISEATTRKGILPPSWRAARRYRYHASPNTFSARPMASWDGTGSPETSSSSI